jgi:hypothetical protein
MRSWNYSSVFYGNPTRHLAILLKPGFTTHQEITAMGRYGKERPNKSFDLIWQDGNRLLPLFEKTESFNERVATSTVKVIRSELDVNDVLKTGVKSFGRFDPTMNPEELKFHDVLGDFKECAPNTFRLSNWVTESRKRQGQNEEQDPHGRIVTVVSILGLGRACRTDNLFAKTFGLYLYTAGIPRRALTLLNKLGITCSYNSIRRAVKAIALNSQGM